MWNVQCYLCVDNRFYNAFTAGFKLCFSVYHQHLLDVRDERISIMCNVENGIINNIFTENLNDMLSAIDKQWDPNTVVSCQNNHNTRPCNDNKVTWSSESIRAYSWIKIRRQTLSKCLLKCSQFHLFTHNVNLQHHI
jgi:hypothetical protein